MRVHSALIDKSFVSVTVRVGEAVIAECPYLTETESDPVPKYRIAVDDPDSGDDTVQVSLGWIIGRCNEVHHPAIFIDTQHTHDVIISRRHTLNLLTVGRCQVEVSPSVSCSQTPPQVKYRRS